MRITGLCMFKKSSSLPLSFTALTLLACGSQPPAASSTPATGTSGAVASRPAVAGSSAAPSGGGSSASVPVTSGATLPGTAGGAGSKAVGSTTTATAGSTGAASAIAGTSAAVAGAPSAGTAAPSGGISAPTKRAAKFTSLAPPLGMPLDKSKTGMWSWQDIEGALSRDGSPAGFYYKVSKTGDKNLLIYLVGGGVCADGFFCNMNPKNKNESLTAENVGAGVGNVLGPDQEAQDPSGARWQSGIFKDDAKNPVKDWNMVFIPYVTGDVFFGSKPNGTVPDVEGTHQFVGKSNMMKFLARIVPTFADAQTVILSGSSAGGIGALLNFTYFADAYIDQGKGARVLMLDDAGPFFDDKYLEVCIQKRYRELYALNESFPADCPGCTDPSGGKLASGVLNYLAEKYPEGLLGALVDSDQDEIMKFFFSEGQEDCAYIDNPITGLLVYPQDRYPAALKNLLTELVPSAPMRVSTYIWTGDLHQNLFQTATDDRFYQQNGLGKSVADFVKSLIEGNTPEHLGLLKQ
mgnify:FL=1